jgi:hypothetical protein
MNLVNGKKLLAGAMLIGLMGVIGGCHWQSHDSDRRYGRTGYYRDGWRDGRDYERRRDGWRDSRYSDRGYRDYYRDRW